MQPTVDDRPARRLLTVDDVAAWLGLPRAAVYRMVRESRFPAVNVGRYRRFDPAAVQKWIDAGGAGLDGAR